MTCSCGSKNTFEIEIKIKGSNNRSRVIQGCKSCAYVRILMTTDSGGSIEFDSEDQR